ncbi:MAG: methyltransferase domain-containing protein [Gallionellaceae bacterium]|nr:MAG: methyltransferase domain-containing protein [Gallionellaceae bacterium]
MIESESGAMRFFNYLGMEKIAWALRRLYCPVAANALVLEVGSGGNPYARANVLLDAYAETRERHWVPLKSDRPTVLGFVENLPFKDKSFDFVIASHVFEHSTDPEKFLRELQRVARAGYIEVPDAFMERINPYRDHRLEITVRQGKLVIRKKPQSTVDETLVELYSDRAKPYIAGELIPAHPFVFHVRYYWQDKIDFVVINPDVDATWPPPTDVFSTPNVASTKSIRQRLLDTMRAWSSQRSRNCQIDWLSLLRCPDCHSDRLVRSEGQLVCNVCGANYPMRNGIPELFSHTKVAQHD